MKFLRMLAALMLVAAMAGTATAQTDHQHNMQDRGAMPTVPAAAPADADAETEEDKRVGGPWPLDTCVVAANSKLGSMGDPIIQIHEGREVRFCCAGCTGAFEANPDEFLARADARIIDEQKPFYPLTHCIVDTDEEVDVNDESNVFRVVGNRLFVLCCPGCARALNANPERYLETLEAAIADSQRDDYALDTCVVSGQPLDAMGGPIERVVGNQLVKLCCAGCDRGLEADPAGALAKLAEARAAQANDTE